MSEDGHALLEPYGRYGDVWVEAMSSSAAISLSSTGVAIPLRSSPAMRNSTGAPPCRFFHQGLPATRMTLLPSRRYPQGR
jgi:hypothetical protein